MGRKDTKVDGRTEKTVGRKFDLKWVLFGLLVIAVAVIAILLNAGRSADDATKLVGTIDIDNGDQKINWDRYQTVDVDLAETLTISESGTYHITGVLEDGSIVVDAGVGEVRLILDNVTLKNSNGPAIYCSSAEDLVIELTGNNMLYDGEIYATSYDEDVDGAIYSKADLTFQGDGTLNLIANYRDGIVGKDDVKFNAGSYNITTNDDAIRGKDSVYVVGGDFVINAVADAIKTTNETDAGKGFVMIENGKLSITSGAKGIKATKTILIYDGFFTIVSHDDAIHSNNYVGVVGGTYSISSGDDGIHADRELIIDGGNLSIEKSYEGLEAQVVTINGGETKIIASDDGMNAGGGADGSANNRAGANTFNTDTNCILSINGGDVYIDSAGDGIDSNGYLYFNGGNVVVDGPTNNGNGALDAGAGIVMNGGSVVAVGASGMAETLGNSSTIYSVSMYFTSVQAAGTNIVIKDDAGNTVVEHTSAKTFNHLAAGTDKFEPGKTYAVYVNGVEDRTFTLNNIVTTVGNSNTNQNNMPGGRQQMR